MAPEWLIAAIVWPAIAAQLFALGSAALALGLLSHHSDQPDYPIIERGVVGPLTPWWRIFAFVNLAFFGILVVAKTAGMADVSWPQALPLISEVMTGTHAGHVWQWQTAIALALAAATLLPLKPLLRAAIVASLAALLLLMGSLTSHAIDYGSTTIVIDFAHQLAGGLWAGALFGCWLIARHGNRDEAPLTIPAAKILSRMALVSVLTLILSGLYLAWRTIGFSLHELLGATYSHVLTVKLLFFAAALAIGAANQLFLIPRLDHQPSRQKLLRNIRAEAVILLVVIGLAALLANTSPARMTMPATTSLQREFATG